MGNTGILLYCIADTCVGELSGILSMDEAYKIDTIRYEKICGIISEVSLDEYGEENIQAKSEDVKWLTEKAEKFIKIIIDINQRTAIIPMKFLTIFNTRERVMDTLKENYDQFCEMLENLKGYEEWSVKIYCNTKFFKANCMTEEINKFERDIAGKPKGAAFFLRKKFDNQLDEIVQDKILNTANQFIEVIKTHSSDLKSNKLLAKELSGRTEQMVLNCSFLLDNKVKESFLNTIDNLRTQNEPLGFIIDCTGPWPPYNFC